MARNPISQALVELEALAKSFTPEDQAEMPHLERPLAKLQGLLKETRKLLARRDSYQARKQEATREARERIRKARMTATLLRKGVTVHYGPDSEQLARFALQPFRGRKRSKKPKEEP
jgi:hypothetical protein